MLATPPHTLTPSRPRWFRALRHWLWLLGHRTRRYRILRAYANETLRYGPMAVPSSMVAPSSMVVPSTRAVPHTPESIDLAFGISRRFPLQPERAAQFYRALDEHE